jgi:hypothetical protein
MVVAATVIAGSVAFGVARFFKRPTLGPDVTAPLAGNAPGRSDPLPNTEPGAIPEVARTAVVSPRESGHVVREPHIRVVAPPVMAPSNAADAGPPPPAGAKKVTFSVYPPGARFFLDGKQTEWQAATFALAAGQHSARVVYDGNCCKSPLERHFNVDDREEQRIGFVMEMKPATIDARGPVGGTYRCANNVVGATPSTQTIPMNKVEIEGVSCTFTSADKTEHRKASLTIKAGMTNILDFGR